MKKKAYMAPATNFIQADLQQIMAGSKITETTGDTGINPVDPDDPTDPAPTEAEGRRFKWDDDEEDY